MKKPQNISEVIRHGLCNRCGSCVGLSNGRIRFSDRTGKYLPVITEPLDEETTKLVWQACSGKGFDFPKSRRRIFGKEEANPFLGHL